MQNFTGEVVVGNMVMIAGSSMKRTFHGSKTLMVSNLVIHQCAEVRRTKHLVVTVSDIFWFRGSDVESWITSDGRAYFVQLSESAYSDTNTSNPDVASENATRVSTPVLFTLQYF